MNRSLIARICALVCVLALSFGVLASCNTAMNAASSEQKANRAFMSQVNEIMNELGEGLDSFVDATSRGDIVNMRTQADNAFRSLDKLDALEAPDTLADVLKKYKEGSAKLREALNAYIALYTDMNAESFDQATYSTRIAEVQGLYDEGVALLQEGDETAAGKE